jgi:Cu/Ag efflux protein CusF
MRTFTAFSLGLALLASACTSTPDRHEYKLQGQIISIAPDHMDATIKHEDIKGFMSAMTMPYKVRGPRSTRLLCPAI